MHGSAPKSEDATFIAIKYSLFVDRWQEVEKHLAHANMEVHFRVIDRYWASRPVVHNANTSVQNSCVHYLPRSNRALVGLFVRLRQTNHHYYCHYASAMESLGERGVHVKVLQHERTR
jgi:hypothetical protein